MLEVAKGIYVIGRAAIDRLLAAIHDERVEQLKDDLEIIKKSRDTWRWLALDKRATNETLYEENDRLMRELELARKACGR